MSNLAKYLRDTRGKGVTSRNKNTSENKDLQAWMDEGYSSGHTSRDEVEADAAALSSSGGVGERAQEIARREQEVFTTHEFGLSEEFAVPNCRCMIVDQPEISEAKRSKIKEFLEKWEKGHNIPFPEYRPSRDPDPDGACKRLDDAVQAVQTTDADRPTFKIKSFEIVGDKAGRVAITPVDPDTIDGRECGGVDSCDVEITIDLDMSVPEEDPYVRAQIVDGCPGAWQFTKTLGYYFLEPGYSKAAVSPFSDGRAKAYFDPGGLTVEDLGVFASPLEASQALAPYVEDLGVFGSPLEAAQALAPYVEKARQFKAEIEEIDRD